MVILLINAYCLQYWITYVIDKQNTAFKNIREIPHRELRWGGSPVPLGLRGGAVCHIPLERLRRKRKQFRIRGQVPEALWRCGGSIKSAGHPDSACRTLVLDYGDRTRKRCPRAIHWLWTKWKILVQCSADRSVRTSHTLEKRVFLYLCFA